MSHDIVFLIVRILIVSLFSCIQYYLYHLLRKEFFSGEHSKKYLPHVRLIFIAMNLPWLYMAFGASVPLPKIFFIAVIYPFSIWQGATLFVFLSVILFKIITLPYRLIRMSVRSIKNWRQNRERNPEIIHSTIQSAMKPFEQNNQQPVANRQKPLINPSRRKFVKGAVAGISIYSFGGAFVGVLQHEQYEIVYQTLHVKNLPEILRGLTIGLMADIHSGIYMNKAEIDEYVGVMNKLKPDLILIPGDFVNNQTIEVFPVCEAFRKLYAPHGIFGCLGNHDFFADENIIANELKRAGIIMLRDEHQVIEIENEKIAFIGVDDVRAKTPLTARLTKACVGLDSSIPSILLCHKPYYLDEVIPYNINLVVSGHTHGGQIILADIFGISLSPASIVSKYVKGLYALENTQMYVTRGIGTVGLPIRLNCPPEITLFTLTTA